MAVQRKYERVEAQDYADSEGVHLEDESDAEDRTSTEIRQHDHETITAEEEAERLLSGNEKSSSRAPKTRAGRSRRKQRWRSSDGEEHNELIYKVEEGARSSSEESSTSSSEVDRQTLGEIRSKRKKSKLGTCCKVTAIHIIIIIAFLALLLGAYRATRSAHPSSPEKPVLATIRSNGTHTFGPTTVLISLDGFRADFVFRGLTPTLGSYIRQGVSPKYMRPSFPSLTFPNHWSIVTGLYPQHHGIVGNTFWDPNMQKEFYYTDPDRSLKPEFWNGEPIWETAELQGIRSAIHMWPGSEAHVDHIEPTFVDKFKMDEHLDVKVERILGWLDLPGPDDEGASEKTPRPQLIAAYVPNVDSDGHKYGPNSTYIRSTIAEVDGMLGSLFKGLEDRNLTEVVNVVIVSDHGMATTSNRRLVQLEDLIDTSLIEHIDGWPLYGLRPYDQSDEQLQSLYEQLLSKSQLPQYKHSFDVYLRDTNMPVRYNFHQNDRIAPLWIVPRVGWAIVTRDEYNIAEAVPQNLVYNPRGLHGYDHEHPLMRAIFVARGPAFPHPQGSQVEPFQNVELYNILCDSLGLEPKPNNGTVRLPFKTTGLHDLEAWPEEVIDGDGDGDGDDDDDGDDGKVEEISVQILPPDLPGVEKVPPALTEPHDDLPEEPPIEDESAGGLPEDGKDDQSEEPPHTWSAWLEWMNSKLEDGKVWVSGIFGGAEEAEETRHGEDWK